MSGYRAIRAGDRVVEFAQATMDNNGRVGQHGEVIDIRIDRGLRSQARVAHVRFASDGAEVWVETRFLRQIDAVEALGRLADD